VGPVFDEKEFDEEYIEFSNMVGTRTQGGYCHSV